MERRPRPVGVPLGLPANTPFNGESLQYCTGTTFNRGSDLGLTCNMQGGASGGVWVSDFNGTWRYTISVNSYHVGLPPSLPPSRSCAPSPPPA